MEASQDKTIETQNLFILLINDVPPNNRRASTGSNIRVPSKVVLASPAGEF